MTTRLLYSMAGRLFGHMALALVFTWIALGAAVSQSGTQTTPAPTGQGATIAPSGQDATAAASDQAEQVAEDPLDSLCTQIGRPLRADEIVDFLGNGLFAGHVVRGVSTAYQEVIGTFEKGRARSVRYLADDQRMAQFVYAQDREVCLTSPGSDDITCGVPLICLSGQADYVMVDKNDAPFVRIDKPAKPDPDAPLPPKGHDWVTFAGGSFNLAIPSEPIASAGVTPSRNINSRDACKVGRGYTALDASYAYSWGTGQCSGAYAAGTGMATYLSDDGQVGTVIMGPKTGIQSRNGQLFWSFPDAPIRVSVKCSNPQDTAIATSAAQVASIDVDLVVPGSVQTGDPVVYTRLVEALRGDVREICGKGFIARATNIRIFRTPEMAVVDLALTWDGLRPTPLGGATSALKRITQRNNSVRTRATTRFAGFIRRSVDAQKTSTVLAALRAGNMLSNIADGMQQSDVRTLVAMTRGLTTWMPWAGRNPDFRNGDFTLNWSVASSDPALEFFKNRRQQPGWATLERVLPISSKARAQLSLTCLVSARDARSLAADRWVLVSATMTSYNNNAMVLRCKAP